MTKAARRGAARWLGGLALGALGLVAGLPSFAGCGGATNGYSAFADAGGATVNDATTSASSSGSGGASSGGSDDSAGQCVTACTADEQCQSSCDPAPSGSSNCCDLGSGTCMMVPQSSCPGPSDSGSE